MSVSLLKQDHAEYVGVVGYGWPPNAITHKLRDDWNHSKTIRTKCGRVSRSVHSASSGRQLRITCKGCLR